MKSLALLFTGLAVTSTAMANGTEVNPLAPGAIWGSAGSTHKGNSYSNGGGYASKTSSGSAFSSRPVIARPTHCAAQNSPLSYNHVDLSYEFIDTDDMGDGNGIELEVSTSLGCNFYGVFSAEYADYDSGDSWAFRLGGGYVVRVAENFHVDLEVGGGYGEDTLLEKGLSIYAGPIFRYALNDRLELFTSILGTASEDDNIVEGTIGGVYMFSDTIGLRLGTQITADEWNAFTGIRLAW